MAYSNLIGYWSIKYGTYGIEDTFDELLQHSASPKGEKRGADVTLTLREDLQKEAYRLIEDMIGSVVVLDVNTGEILAMASSPSFSVNELEEKWEEINQTDGVFYSNAYQNPVSPGSVFKLVTSKAILEEGMEKEKVDDEGSMVIHGQTIRNYNGTAYGPLDFEGGFVKSSNVYFMNRALKMGGRRLQEAAESFLLGQEIALDFGTIKSTFHLDDYNDNLVAATAFGQGETLVTPLHMAMIVQSIANEGKMNKPYLIRSVVNAKGKVIQEGKEEILTETMEASTAKKIREVMTKAGEAYGLKQVGKDGKIAAKTGTAQRGDGTNNAWLVSFAPAQNPRYVVVANRLKTKEIGKSMAPVVEALYESLFQQEQ
ncbi:MAG: penicillin-binding transpeptidase domain-containing protein [Eubacteriales bacterium]|nr:penicillin-binding transpeptidase domain-containing protein [Eubacteriales bacterium]